MKIFPFKNGKASRSDAANGSGAAQCLCDQHTGLYLEGYFRDLLCLERKRTERSRRPFVLMLLDITRAFQGPRSADVGRMMAEVLFTCTRETDIRGWYAQGSVI